MHVHSEPGAILIKNASLSVAMMVNAIDMYIAQGDHFQFIQDSS